ncbi:hypothetical protein GGR52DRAFT_584978 [Hypoxylon sp. FL1284]|nr:hypothetical protein GGR52DRAFT_584978 [Hypoxylon sp. FL1284]
MESDISRQLNSSLSEIVANNQGYSAAHALLVSWAEADDDGIAEEVKLVRSLFEQQFGFNVSEYLIPTEDPVLSLSEMLCGICRSSRREGNANGLLIFYYAGHGDVHPDGKAIWAAKSRGEPTLIWNRVHPSLDHWKGDVLMILDCCFALTVFRGITPETFEILAACGVKEMTPRAGERSFTTRFVKVLSSQLAAKGSTTIEDVWNALIRLKGNDSVHQTPIRALFGGKQSIELKPLTPGSNAALPLRDSRPLALLALTVSISSPLDHVVMRRFQTWVRTHLPKDISSITVDQVFLQTEQIQAWMHESRRAELHAAIARDLRTRGQKESVLLQPSLFDANLPKVKIDELDPSMAKVALADLQEWNAQVYQAILRNLLLSPSFFSSETAQELSQDPKAGPIGLAESAKLRLLNEKLAGTFDYSTISALPFNSVTQIKDFRQYAVGKYRNDLVILESRLYGEGGQEKETVVAQVKKLSRLLREVSHPMFHIAPYVGYIDQPSRHRFGLLFTVPGHVASINNAKAPFITLKDAYKNEKVMSLNVRANIALRLARALSSLHAVGWLHKSIRSENIIFIQAQRQQEEEGTEDMGPSGRSAGAVPTFDFSRPHLFGFDISRSGADMSNATREFRPSNQPYTHPARWGRPTETFSMLHDAYALGVVLLEVGCWRPATHFDPSRKGFADVNNEHSVRERLVLAADTELRHRAGDRFSAAVQTCLTDELEEVAKRVDDPSAFHRAFAANVIDQLARCLASF